MSDQALFDSALNHMNRISYSPQHGDPTLIFFCVLLIRMCGISGWAVERYLENRLDTL